MKLDDFIEYVKADSNFNIVDNPQCPVPPYCDNSECPPHTCVKRLVVERYSPYGLYHIPFNFPSKEIDNNSPSLNNIIKAGLTITKKHS